MAEPVTLKFIPLPAGGFEVEFSTEVAVYRFRVKAATTTEEVLEAALPFLQSVGYVPVSN